MSQMEYLSGEELWDKCDALYALHINGARRHSLSEMPGFTQKVWHAFAAELQIPRPKPPTLAEVFDQWSESTRLGDDAEKDIEELRQRLNAAHEAKERRA